ncbi:hypothetical protein ALC62_01521, partial [Cyphomyrmex costatus]
GERKSIQLSCPMPGLLTLHKLGTRIDWNPAGKPGPVDVERVGLFRVRVRDLQFLTPNPNGADDHRSFDHQVEPFFGSLNAKNHRVWAHVGLNSGLQIASQSHRAVSHSTPPT